MLNLSNLLESTAREVPGRVAVRDLEREYTYAELNAFANRIAHGLADAGMGPGKKVALICPANAFFPAVYFGILKTGAIVVPLNILLKSEQILTQLQFAEIDAMICHADNAALDIAAEAVPAFKKSESCRQLWLIGRQGEESSGIQPFADLEAGRSDVFDTVPRQADDVAIINYTSGTTGLPKAALLSHGSDLSGLHAWMSTTRIRREDTVLSSIGLFTGYGRSVAMNPAFRSGATLVLAPRFEPRRILEQMLRYGCTVFVGVPSMYHAFRDLHAQKRCDLKRFAGQWRLGFYGGAAMNADLKRFLNQEIGLKLFQVYGLTECGLAGHAPVNAIVSDEADRMIPPWGTQVRIVDEAMAPVRPGQRGEVIVRGACVMNGYCNNPEATREAFRGGWFHTGDVGYFREDGSFVLVDRLVETINRGGYKIYPAELERALMRHPAIDRAAVKGIPDARLGQEIAAFVTLRAGQELTEKELHAWGRDAFPKYAYPRHVRILDSMPTGPTGKVIKSRLPALDSES
jgi:long-chain acyl-CoA synthetase